MKSSEGHLSTHKPAPHGQHAEDQRDQRRNPEHDNIAAELVGRTIKDRLPERVMPYVNRTSGLARRQWRAGVFASGRDDYPKPRTEPRHQGENQKRREPVNSLWLDPSKQVGQSKYEYAQDQTGQELRQHCAIHGGTGRRS